jgi:segregation and condensation protein B
MEQETTQPNTLPSIQNIQSILFYLGEPVSFRKLASLFEVEVSSIEALIPDLEALIKETGLSLVIHDGQIQLVTSPSSHEIIEKLRKDELTKELSKAALETLSIILYQDNVSRGDIDFIRGVNSSFILRNLLVRGLIIRKPHPTDARAFIYTGSHELFAFLGVSGPKELPEFERVRGLLQEKVEHLGDSQKENE